MRFPESIGDAPIEAIFNPLNVVPDKAMARKGFGPARHFHQVAASGALIFVNGTARLGGLREMEGASPAPPFVIPGGAQRREGDPAVTVDEG
jgi:hypothetical protein